MSGGGARDLSIETLAVLLRLGGGVCGGEDLLCKAVLCRVFEDDGEGEEDRGEEVGGDATDVERERERVERFNEGTDGDRSGGLVWAGGEGEERVEGRE